MLRNSSGNKDAILTLAVVGFAFCLIKVLLAGVTIAVAGRTFDCGTIDGSSIAAILAPTLGAYVGRRYTDRKYGGDPVPGVEAVKLDPNATDAAAAKK
jgi:hypothetical protein